MDRVMVPPLDYASYIYYIKSLILGYTRLVEDDKP